MKPITDNSEQRETNLELSRLIKGNGDSVIKLMNRVSDLETKILDLMTSDIELSCLIKDNGESVVRLLKIIRRLAVFSVNAISLLAENTNDKTLQDKIAEQLKEYSKEGV